MDMLDPLDISHEEHDNKAILQQSLSMEDHSIGSDDVDDPHVEHLSPQTLLETPDDDVQYSFRTPEGTVTYGVLKVEEETVPQLAIPTFTSASVPQLVTSNINGQLYVISNASDVFVSHQATTGTRPIVPRATMVESTPVVPVTSNKKVKRDERRRATHNEVERRRRDKINNWINKLAKIIPETSGEMKSNGHYDGQSKGGILAKACEYIAELRASQRLLEETEVERKRLEDALEDAKRKNASLDMENKALRELLQQHGVQLLDESS
ncbi:upstream stimulatory factor 2 isoform X2 [Atheta coriaria]|uniref:upstream stimulatory factor 2 isoform X2 n=1 Tax=Dalotia coriaria TaxID=877792 RepID=UPI0031F45F53